VSGCCIPLHNNEKLTGVNVGCGFDIADVETFSSGSETTYWSFQGSVILQEICSAWWQPALLKNKCLLSMIMLWIAEDQIQKSSLVNNKPFSTVLW